MTFNPNNVLALVDPNITKVEAEADIRVIADHIGKTFARTVIGATMMHDLEPDDIEAMVDRLLDRMKDELGQVYAAAGLADKGDVDIFTGIVRTALVREGAYISRTATWEAGSA